MPKYKVSMKLFGLSDAPFAAYVLNIAMKMTDNAGFPTPRIPPATLEADTNAFIEDVAAARGGGLEANAKKNASREALESKVREQAAYVQSIAGTNLELLLSSGFEAASTNRAQIVLPKAVIKKIKTIQSGTFKIIAEIVPTKRGYEVRYKNGTGDYINGGFFTSSRAIMLLGLTPGNTYTVQIRAMGGQTGSGDWSDPVSQMAI